MAGFFNQNQGLSQRAMLANRYRSARLNLLLVAIMTLVNIALVATGGDTYFLFSAIVPYLLAYIGAMYCGLFSPEVYEYLEIDVSTAEFLPMPFFYVVFGLSIVIVALYVLAFALSGKGRVGWLIFALIFFAIDTLSMLLYFGISFDMILDYVFHAWVIVILAVGIKAHRELESLPPDEPIVDQPLVDVPEDVNE